MASGIRLNLAINDENTMLEGSTAPTTPEGSQEFSPVMRPLVRPVDVEDARTNGSRVNGAAVASQNPAIRTICCVGAGYVGMLKHLCRLGRLDPLLCIFCRALPLTLLLPV